MVKSQLGKIFELCSLKSIKREKERVCAVIQQSSSRCCVVEVKKLQQSQFEGLNRYLSLSYNLLLLLFLSISTLELDSKKTTQIEINFFRLIVDRTCHTKSKKQKHLEEIHLIFDLNTTHTHIYLRWIKYGLQLLLLLLMFYMQW